VTAVRFAPSVGVIGDSHADPFLGAYTVNADGTPRTIARTAFVPVLMAEEFLVRGAIAPPVVLALAALRLLLYCAPDAPNALPASVMEPNVASPPWGTAWRANPWLNPTPLLFVVGEVSARTIYRAIPQHAEVETPFDPASYANVPPFGATGHVAWPSLHAAVEKLFTPYVRGLAMLRDAGLGPIAVHSISPPSVDDEASRTSFGFPSNARVRTKVVMACNAHLAEACTRLGVTYVDRWDDFTDGGAPREGIMADATHVREAAMLASLLAVERLCVAPAPGSESWLDRLAQTPNR
jgi:hypothetical protein